MGDIIELHERVKQLEAVVEKLWEKAFPVKEEKKKKESKAVDDEELEDE